MKSIFSVVFLVLSSVPVFASETLRLAVTTSFRNSGLADHLLPIARKELGINVEILVVGSGQAFKLAKSGDVDAVLVHSKAAEIAFVRDGYATHRREIMYNDFIVLGPSDDPAEIADTVTAHAAFERLVAAQPIFVSRGDSSGTHTLEVSIWAAADRDPAQFGNWYRAVGAGMGQTLNIASAMDAYTLSDRASWLNYKNKSGLSVVFEGDPILFNQYSFLPVNPAKHPHVSHEVALIFETWLTSERAEQVINGFNIAGDQAFVFNAAD